MFFVAHCPCTLCLCGNNSGCGSCILQHVSSLYHLAYKELFFFKLPGTEGGAPGLRNELSCKQNNLLPNHRGQDQTTDNSNESCKLNLPNSTPSKILKQLMSNFGCVIVVVRSFNQYEKHTGAKSCGLLFPNLNSQKNVRENATVTKNLKWSWQTNQNRVGKCGEIQNLVRKTLFESVLLNVLIQRGLQIPDSFPESSWTSPSWHA